MAIEAAMRFLSLCLALLVTACASARFERIGVDPASYQAQHPYYAEYCAVSQIKKRPGFGADIRGEIGGHAVFYLNGACKKPDEAYPVLELCEGGGVGLSVNEHFRNAKWVAAPGHDFFFAGNLGQGAAVTPAAYQAVQREAQRLGIYDGVAFHEKVFDDMPAGWTREDWKYEMSIGTDYAIGLARGRYCARVPVDRAAMARMVTFLNAENAPYRAGKVFHWSILSDNCIHLAHNALAAAGLWDVWPTGRFILISMFDFPVPKNEFVNLMRRTNDALPDDPGAAYDDAADRRSLLEAAVLPSRPGALAESRPPIEPNLVYETSELKLIFYDEPLFGPYQDWFDQIWSEPRYQDPRANRAYFASRARRILAQRKPLDWWLQRARYGRDPAGFAAVYDRYYALMTRLADPG
ncbi:MAG TPA: hypothetical protein VE650_18495 [Acetobacteraceae bacterium]|nr:hypothetical protein [Acetobacteraceae bacterium]